MVKLDKTNPISESDWLVTIEDTTLGDIYFSMFSGLNVKVKRPKIPDGLSARMRTGETGTTEYSDFTLEAPFDPLIHDKLITFCEERINGAQYNVTIRPVKRSKDNEFRGNKSLRMTGCRIAEYEFGKVDAAGGDKAAMIKIVSSVEEGTYSGAGTRA